MLITGQVSKTKLKLNVQYSIEDIIGNPGQYTEILRRKTPVSKKAVKLSKNALFFGVVGARKKAATYTKMAR